MSRIQLIAASDDYLLELRMADAVAEASSESDGVEPEVQAGDVTPERVATELVSPSLFAVERVLVVPDARWWFEETGAKGSDAAESTTPDVTPLVRVLSDGVPEGMALVMGACCRRKPGGPLVEALDDAGAFQWIPLPPPPKPWEDTVLSGDQIRVLEAVMGRVADGARFSRPAKKLLLERLGFAPRLLVQEVRKLAGAAGGAEVDEDLVRSLCFRRERSLEGVRDAVLERRLEPLLDLVAAASSGAPITGWQGQRMDPRGLGPTLVAQVGNLLQQMLYLRRLATAAGFGDDLDPARTSRKGWYPRRFKETMAAPLLDRIKADAPSPLIRPGRKPPTPYSLGGLFAGASRYTDEELCAALEAVSTVETGSRSSPQEGLPYEALTAWLAAVVGARPR